MIAHIAATPDEAGGQQCVHCGAWLHRPGTGAGPPFYPGQLVEIQLGGQVRCSLRKLPEGYRECAGPYAGTA